MKKKTDVVVVGGGLGGLAVAVMLARGGRKVTLLEKSKHLGGRAHTTEVEGYHFNLGPHALYLGGAAARVLGKLGVPMPGRSPGEGSYALRGGRLHPIPAGAVSLLMTDLLGAAGKLELGRVMTGLMKTDAGALEGRSVSEWLDEHVTRKEVREVVEAFFRVSTYCADMSAMAADVAVEQFQLARKGVRYLDGGWSELVRALAGMAREAGVEVVGSAKVESVESVEREAGAEPGRVRGVRLADGTEYEAEAVVVAGGPRDVAALLPGDEGVAGWVAESRPVKAATLDVGLSTLPKPRALFALGMDRPWYVSVHSAFAKLAPEGGAMVHVAKYLGGAEETADEAELEGVLDVLQPGWREHVVTKRFLPGLTVMNALPARSLEKRPGPRVEHVRGLYVVGDWVGGEGLLVDASLASAETVSRLLSTEAGARAA
ncbi:phytoene dehydrogenase-like protein [Archangium gephyra]|uniref:Phytoene dehydrogenase n=1 Tax=Archangium gephyra TaxID=48 RepID=A0AAC8Q1S8_9BACT|nr:FAD-dependent oxidoreductase [Archangium gephyra]AKI99226.1 Phytoene dehydrogenase [Archangium gephyra]REG31131.1 phytoene dehydrogenase-like protein [Archangium gephyra]